MFVLSDYAPASVVANTLCYKKHSLVILPKKVLPFPGKTAHYGHDQLKITVISRIGCYGNVLIKPGARSMISLKAQGIKALIPYALVSEGLALKG
ncbi:hypothetical protein L1987_52688 [Smallanthus sonchifolius]|uniref:Uncharacterized protein n=1 Tax=Smallanthus sonchifolius TaxID=185202 RepID=A0ACB9ET68_9ASTR|nr:hypothetical protein L1987_52688 [Smallanthus sonchifolius]